MKLPLIVVSLFVFPSLMFGGDIVRSHSFQARSDNSVIIINWITDDETNVVRFKLERRAGIEGAFVHIASLAPKGPSTYQYIDNTAYKESSTLYQYQLKIELTGNQAPVEVGPISVMHTVSGVRKTWGSIKAMFR